MTKKWLMYVVPVGTLLAGGVKTASADTLLLAKPGVNVASIPGTVTNAQLAKIGVCISRSNLGTPQVNAMLAGGLVAASEQDSELVAFRQAPVKDGRPNDPLLAQQPWLDRTGIFELIKQGSPRRAGRLSFLDTGVDRLHEDLVGKLQIGPSFIASEPDAGLDSNGHGTHVAGIAGATTNNGIGIVGAGGGNRLYSDKDVMALIGVKVMDQYGKGTFASVAAGIVYAGDLGPGTIISLSLGGPFPSEVLERAVAYAISKGAIVVCAAGNTGTTAKTYPAACRGVISVAATDAQGRIPKWSTHGSWVTLAAPGASILSTLPGNRYGVMTGTSMSAPLVAGLFASVYSMAKTTPTPEALIRSFTSTASEIPGSRQVRFGAINAFEAWKKLR